MGIFQTIKSWFQAAATVDEPAPPKPSDTRPGSNALPSYVTTATPASDTFLPQDDLRLATTDIASLRLTTTTSSALLRKLVEASPDLSAANFTATRLAVSPRYTCIARNLDGTLYPEATALVQQLCRKFDNLPTTLSGSATTPAQGFNDFPSLRSLSESLANESLTLGAMALELVLDKSRLPQGFRPVAVDTIKFKYDKNKRRVPYQVLGSEELSLDYPTFFYVALDQRLRTAYATSPLQAALQPVQAQTDFMNDLRRVFRRAIHPRLRATIDTEKWLRTLPPRVLNDAALLRQHQDGLTSQIQTMFDNLSPEDAVVMFDMINAEYLTGGNNSLSEEYKVLSSILDSKLAAGAKTSGVVLNHASAASNNIASTQSMLLVKNIEGAVQLKLNEILSRALTLAVRLYGVPAIVEFAWEEIDLRPAKELEAFKAMKQSRILELLSLGLTTDEEASLETTGSLPLPGMPKLAGTMFKTSAQANVSTPTSNTSALNQTLSPSTPKEAKS